MATMTVSLPDTLKRWIEAQVEAGHYASPSDYLHDLVRRDRECKDGTGPLHDLLTEAEASGISPRGLDEIFAEAEGTAKQRGLINRLFIDINYHMIFRFRSRSLVQYNLD